MTEKPDGNGATFSRFINERVAPLAKAFASTPLMELRVRTSEGLIRLVKTAEASLPARPSAGRPALRIGPRPHLTPVSEPGHPYEIINAGVVGIFAAAPDLPAPGSQISDDRVLGYIEALKLKHPVRSGGPGVLVAQVAEDGEPVDFGEALFVLDRADAPKPAVAAPPPPQPEPLLEPPRL
jgi:acetyl-CoA carboxylase biotin carboxyl carrier protein